MRNLRRFTFTLSVLALLISLTTAQVVSVRPRYSIRELPPVAGYVDSSAVALNDFGDAVGSCSRPGSNWDTVATVWHDGISTALGIASGGNCSYAEGINNAGRICGEADDGDIRPLGCIFEGGQARTIDRGGNNSRGIYVSASGVVVGNYARGFGTTWLAVHWTERADQPGRYDPEFLPLYTDPTAAETYAYVNGANNSLQTVGQLGSTQWSARGGYWHNDPAHTLYVLPPLPNQWDSYANGINDLGMIVGLSDVGIYSSTPVTWTSHPNFDVNALPLFAGETQGTALAINNSNVIIGSHGQPSRPAVWHNRRIYDLQGSLDATGVGWNLIAVTDINERGQIVGYGTHFGNFRGFVLTPSTKQVITR